MVKILIAAVLIAGALIGSVVALAQPLDVQRPETITEYENIYGKQDYRNCVVFESKNLAKVNISRCPEIVDVYLHNYWQIIDIGPENCIGSMFSGSCASIAYMKKLNLLERLLLEQEQRSVQVGE